MDKQEIYEYLKQKNIWYEITEHKAVYNMQELSQIDIPYPQADAKNLFIRDDIMDILNLIPGAVTPLGLLNDKELKVQFYIDKDFFEGLCIIGIHPNDNTATIWLKVADLIDIIKEHGNKITITEI